MDEENKPQKMSKSGNNEPTGFELTAAQQIAVLKDQINYWKLRHDLLLKFGNVSPDSSAGRAPNS